jgi:hypothetical protein
MKKLIGRGQIWFRVMILKISKWRIKLKEKNLQVRNWDKSGEIQPISKVLLEPTISLKVTI